MRKRRNITRTFLTMLAVGLLAMTWTATTAWAGDGTSPDDGSSGNKYPDDSKYLTTFQSNVLVVKMYPQFSAIELDEKLNVSSVEKSLAHSNTYLVKISGDANPEALAADMAGQSGIAYAHPNYTLNALHPVQGSIPFSDEVHIGSFEGQAAVNMTNLVAAHTDATGDQITVGVIDGGIEFSHPALEGKAVSGWDYIDNDDYANDEPGGVSSGHGTFVAGLVHLVAPDATIRAYRIMDANGYGEGFSLAQAIEQAVDDGCDVINLSVVLTDQHLAVQDAINYATAKGVIVIAAAGNDATDTPVYPAAESNVIAVAALDTLLHAADFTNFGAYIDVCAPGVGTYSAYQGDLYAWWNGTSFAAPFVAGEAALLRQDYPTLLAAQIKGKILASSQSVDAVNPAMDGKLGYGLIDPSAALESTSGGTDTASIIPDTIFFTHILGAEYFANPEISALLLSSNAPAAYSIEVTPTVDTFVTYYSGTGFTNDSIHVSFVPGYLPVGEYFNELKVTVDGVSNPVYLEVGLKVIPEPPIENEAHFTQSEVFFTTHSTNDPVFYGAGYLTSSNAPAAFTAEVAAYYEFVTLQTFSGTTDDSVYFEIDPGKVPGPGIYIDTILCLVDGVLDPAKLLIQLTVDDSDPQPDTVIISPLAQSFEMVCYTLDTLVGQIAVLYEGNSHRWTAVNNDPKDFLTITDSVGYTSDSVRFVMSAGSLPPGYYTDEVAIYVEGLTASPVIADITLHVQDSSEIPSPIFLSPSSLSFTAVEGAIEIQTGCAMTYAVFFNPPPIPNWTTSGGTFASVVDTTGTIYDSICVQVDPTGLGVGSYTDTIFIEFDEYVETAKLPVNLLIESSDTTIYPYGDSIVLFPFGTATLVCEEGSTTPATMSKALWNSDGGSRPYTGLVANGGQFTELLTTSGMTPDTVRFTLDPTGFPIGEYFDTIFVAVQGYPDPAIQETRLIVNPVGQDSLVLDPPGGFHINYYVGDTAVFEYHYRVLATTIGATVPFVGTVKDGGQFTELLTTSGVTPDTIRFNIDPTGFAVGAYEDTMYFTAEGYNDTAVLVNYMTIMPPDTSPPYPLTLSPWHLYFTVDEGSTDLLTGCAYLWSQDSVSAPYTADYYNGDGPWMDILTQSGMTPDTVCIQVDPTGLTSGQYYYDAAAFSVEGYEYPAVLQVHLTVNPVDTTPPPQAGVYFFLPFKSFHVDEGSTDVITGGGFLYATDSSISPFTGYVQPGSHFTELLTTSGMTFDSIYYEVDPTGLSAGVYYDSVYFDVEGFDKSPLLTLKLYIDATSDTTNPGDTTQYPLNAVVMPSLLDFVVDEGATDLTSACAYLWCSDSVPVPFIGYAQSDARFTSLLTTTGETFDSVCVEVDPTGFSAGTYYDSVYFDVEGIQDSVMLTVRLIVNGGSDTLYTTSSTLSQNYPNPFNPTTIISFNLSSDSHVSLDIYNVLGRKVTTLVNETLGAGEHSVEWDASAAASGIYFYRLNIGGKVETKKMVLLR